MLEIIDNILEKERDELIPEESFGRSTSFDTASGVYLPSKNSNESSSPDFAVEEAERFFGQILDSYNVYLYILQSAWQDDSPRMNYLGIKNEFKSCGLEKAIVAQTSFKNEVNNVRFAGLASIEEKATLEALKYTANNQRFSFLTLSGKGNISPDIILSLICDSKVCKVENSRTAQLFDWSVLLGKATEEPLVFVKGIGWNEEHCDFRFLGMGTRAVLEQVLEKVDLQ